MKNNRKFKGVWVPVELYFDTALSWNEKILFLEVTSLDNEDGCFAKNTHFQEMLNVSDTTISNMLAKLTSKGYIYEEQRANYGQPRILHSNFIVSLKGLESKEFDTPNTEEEVPEPSQETWPSDPKNVEGPSQETWPAISTMLASHPKNVEINNISSNTTNKTSSITNINSNNIFKKRTANLQKKNKNKNLQNGGEPNDGTIEGQSYPDTNKQAGSAKTKTAYSAHQTAIKNFTPVENLRASLKELLAHFTELRENYSSGMWKKQLEALQELSGGDIVKMFTIIDKTIARGFYSIKAECLIETASTQAGKETFKPKTEKFTGDIVEGRTY